MSFAAQRISVEPENFAGIGGVKFRAQPHWKKFKQDALNLATSQPLPAHAHRGFHGSMNNNNFVADAAKLTTTQVAAIPGERQPEIKAPKLKL